MTRYSTIEDALGGPRGRYFGDGHRGSAYALHVNDVGDGHTSGTGSVEQHGAWSLKGGDAAPRHLSSIDSVALAELALEPVLAGGPVPLESLFVSRASLRAGSSSTQSLTSIPVGASAVWNAETNAFHCRASVGSMKLELTIVSRSRGSAGTNAHGPNFLARHLQDRVQHLSDIEVDRITGALKARWGSSHQDGSDRRVYSGIQSSHAHELSICEAIVSLAQLAQVVAYELDDIAREDSSTFWLRRLDVSMGNPPLHVGSIAEVEVRVDRATELSMGIDRWRSLRLSADCPHLNAVADVAHMLPRGSSR